MNIIKKTLTSISMVLLPLFILFSAPSAFAQEVGQMVSNEPSKIAFTMDAIQVFGILGVPLLGLLGWLFNIHGRMSKLEGINEGKTLAQRGSPMKLTKEGEKLLHDSGGKKYLESNKEVLLREFDETINAFDIQEKAKELIRKKMKENSKSGDINEIKAYLFKEGREINEIVLVMGLELRDIVLNDKGIQIDQSDTNKEKHKVGVKQS